MCASIQLKDEIGESFLIEEYAAAAGREIEQDIITELMKKNLYVGRAGRD